MEVPVAGEKAVMATLNLGKSKENLNSNWGKADAFEEIPTVSVAFLDIDLTLKHIVKIHQKLIQKDYIYLRFNITKLAKSSEIVTSSFSYDLF